MARGKPNGICKISVSRSNPTPPPSGHPARLLEAIADDVPSSLRSPGTSPLPRHQGIAPSMDVRPAFPPGIEFDQPTRASRRLWQGTRRFRPQPARTSRPPRNSASGRATSPASDHPVFGSSLLQPHASAPRIQCSENPDSCKLWISREPRGGVHCPDGPVATPVSRSIKQSKHHCERLWPWRFCPTSSELSFRRSPFPTVAEDRPGDPPPACLWSPG